LAIDFLIESNPSPFIPFKIEFWGNGPLISEASFLRVLLARNIY